MLRVIKYFTKSLKVTGNDTLEKGVSLYLVPVPRHSALNNGVTLKSGSQVTQGHSNWYHSKAWVWFPIRLP